MDFRCSVQFLSYVIRAAVTRRSVAPCTPLSYLAPEADKSACAAFEVLQVAQVFV